MKQKHVIGCLLAISLVLFSCSSNSPVNGDKSQIKSMQQSDDDDALQLGEELYKSFSIGVTRNKDTADEIMPSYFGGSYSDSEGNLIVLIKNSDKDGMDDIHRRIGKHACLKFKKCTYSLHELRTLKGKLSDIYINDEKLRKKLKWNSVGISIEANRIVVFLEDISTEAINKFKRLVSDSPMIIFEEMKDAENLSYIMVDSITREIFNADDVIMEIEKQVIPISVETLGVTVINNTDKDVEFGNIYYIEKSEADKWNRIALDRDTLGNIIVYDLAGHTLKPHAFIKKTYNLIKCAYNYKAGKYRIVIPYIQNGVDMEMSSEFTVAGR